MSSTCACGKRGYTSEHAARMAHRRCSWRLRVYWCTVGGWWHATAAEKR